MYTYYSFRTATVFLLHPELLVIPSESVPSSTLYAFESACVWMSSIESVCLFGQAAAPERELSAVKTVTTTVLSIVRSCGGELCSLGLRGGGCHISLTRVLDIVYINISAR